MSDRSQTVQHRRDPTDGETSNAESCLGFTGTIMCGWLSTPPLEKRKPIRRSHHQVSTASEQRDERGADSPSGCPMFTASIVSSNGFNFYSFGPSARLSLTLHGRKITTLDLRDDPVTTTANQLGGRSCDDALGLELTPCRFHTTANEIDTLIQRSAANNWHNVQR